MHHHHHHKIALAALFCAAALAAGCSRAEPPPAAAPGEPYHLPTIEGALDARVPAGALEPPAAVDTRALFDAVIACHPTRTWFRGELQAIARAGTRTALDLDGTITGGTHYAGIVLRIPLYSAVERDREIEREQARRNAAAAAVAALHDALARRATARREIALYRSLESRAALRVRHGVAETGEQVRMAEKLVGAINALAKAEADIEGARLTLRGMCGAEQTAAMDALLSEATR